MEHAFAQTSALAGEPIPGEELPDRASLPVAGEVPVRVIATIPATASLYRLDQLIAALLEAGIRIFEWNGPMLHAKTAVADGHWARVGSTNLSIASWIGNWELDVAVEDDRFGQVMQEVYLEDLRHANEVVLHRPRRMQLVGRPSPLSHGSERGHGSAGRAAAGAIGIGSTIGAAITNHRVLGPAEARLTALAGLSLLLVAMLAVLWPRVIAVPFAAIGLWVSAALFVRAWRLWREIPRSARHRPGHAGPGTADERRGAEG